MAKNSDLAVEPGRSPAAPGESSTGVAIEPGHIRVTTTELLVFDMTPDAARALVEAKRAEFEIPAIEQTRQAEQRTRQVREETKQHYATTAVIAAVAVGVLAMLLRQAWAGEQPDTRSLLFLLALVLIQRTAPGVVDALKEWMRSRS